MGIRLAQAHSPHSGQGAGWQWVTIEIRSRKIIVAASFFFLNGLSMSWLAQGKY
jgi:hypothetical protein